MWRICVKEISGFLNSPVAYITVTVFLTGTGLFLWILPEYSILEYGFAEAGSFFYLAPYILLFLIPAITMRSFAEEKKTGTLDMLLAKPISDFGVVLGKYLGCLFLTGLALLPTLVYYFSIYRLGSPVGNIDSAGYMTSFLGLFFLGAVFTAIGVFSSTLSDNQIVSFIVALLLCFFMYDGLNLLGTLDLWPGMRDTFSAFSLTQHYESLSRGLIDSKDLVYFLGVTLVALQAAKLSLGSRKW